MLPVRFAAALRTFGLHGRFDEARAILAAIAAGIDAASPEAGTAANRESARSHYMHAFQIASEAKLDSLAIDAQHMMPLVDTEPSQPAAKRWEASLRNNVGYAKHLAGDYDEALRKFQRSLAAHERTGNAHAVRVAHWMIALTYRAQHRHAEAIEVPLRLEREWDAAGKPSPYVYEELEHLYRTVGDDSNARHCKELLAVPPV